MRVLLLFARRLCSHTTLMSLGILDYGREEQKMCMGCGEIQVHPGPAVADRGPGSISTLPLRNWGR